MCSVGAQHRLLETRPTGSETPGSCPGSRFHLLRLQSGRCPASMGGGGWSGRFLDKASAGGSSASSQGPAQGLMAQPQPLPPCPPGPDPCPHGGHVRIAASQPLPCSGPQRWPWQTLAAARPHPLRRASPSVFPSAFMPSRRLFSTPPLVCGCNTSPCSCLRTRPRRAGGRVDPSRMPVFPAAHWTFLPVPEHAPASVPQPPSP